ncbi:MAG: DUF1569 domain-containing protein [Planctomycetes bacterium]|nr:DUF1569 domain-containing protein [Planctomycetota bacterium]
MREIASVSDIIPEVDRLAASPHRSLGNWTLAQACKHLADSFDGSIEGFNMGRHRFKRWFFRRRMLAHAFTKGIPRGATVDPALTPPADVDQPQARAELRRAIERYLGHRGRLKPHPLFGRMSRAEWDRLHCVHAAHHLSLLVPLDSRG